MTRSRMAILCLMLFVAPVISSGQDTNQRRVDLLSKMTLDQVKTKHGFEYYSGYLPNRGSGNFPTMYAHGSGNGSAITVVGRGFMCEYPVHEWRKAIRAYRALLIESGYEVPPE